MTFSTLWISGCNLFLVLGALQGLMVGQANRAAMSEVANARGSHTEPVVRRPADDGRQTPACFGIRPSNTRTSSMKIEELDVDTGPICLATAACLRNALLYTSYVFL